MAKKLKLSKERYEGDRLRILQGIYDGAFLWKTLTAKRFYWKQKRKVKSYMSHHLNSGCVFQVMRPCYQAKKYQGTEPKIIQLILKEAVFAFIIITPYPWKSLTSNF